MEGLDYTSVLKWVAIVLAAAFVGQFGRSLAQYLIKALTRLKGRPEPDAEDREAAAAGPGTPATIVQQGGPQTMGSRPSTMTREPSADDAGRVEAGQAEVARVKLQVKADKKAAKAAAKQVKKS